MQNDPVDLLQIKIEQAKSKLPDETLHAIASVDWRGAIYGLRQEKGYTFEQLGDLELQTELLLYGLISIEQYPKKLEQNMGLSKPSIDALLERMNQLVFQRIKEEMIKNSERKEIFAQRKQFEINTGDRKISQDLPQQEETILQDAGIHLLPNEENLDSFSKNILSNPQSPISVIPKETEKNTSEIPKMISGNNSLLSQKFSGATVSKVVTTTHTLDNLSKSGKDEDKTSVSAKSGGYTVDPYREIPEK